MSQKIYIVEDDASIRELESYALKSAGFETLGFENSRDFFAQMESHLPDLILLDIMLPGTDGLKVLETIRSTPAYSKLPVILVGVMELISRVKALLRRIDRVKKEDLNYGTIRIDVSRHTVQVDGNEVELTYKEYEILKYLMKNRGIVLTRDSLMEKIWGYDFEHGNRTVDVHIQSLRKKLGTAGDAIKTIRNVGYKIGD